MNAMFDDLNSFSPHAAQAASAWSARLAAAIRFVRFGPMILLNKRMDRPEVPRYEFAMYHEMLHVKHPTRRSGCTLLSHSPEFRGEEKLFPGFERARKALDRLAR
jgi:hypothetical protein